MICKKCGNEIEGGAKFCGKCGSRIVADNFSDKASKNLDSSRYIAFLIIGIFVIVITVIFVFTMKWLRNDESRQGVTTTLESGNKPDVAQDSSDSGKLQNSDEDMASEIRKETESEDEKNSRSNDVDVESEIQRIRNKYNSIQDNVEMGKYQSIDMGNGIIHYLKDGSIKSIVAKDGKDYVRYYYFEKNTLFFAYYEGVDAHRFYFFDGSLIRWRYTEDAMDIDNAIDHDLENNDEFFWWEDTVRKQAQKYKNLEKKSDSKKIKAVTKRNVTSITASSTLSERGMTHSAQRIWDGSLDKVWVEGADGQGIGESVIVKFDTKCLVKGIHLYAGYQKSESLYYKNSRPSGIRLEFSDGSYDTYKLEDVYGKQTMRLSNPVVTKSIRIVIEDVYEGEKYSDTVISEIEIY